MFWQRVVVQTLSACRGHLDFERGVILREMEEVEKTTEEATTGHFFFSAVALLCFTVHDAF
jgi:hypothetical protein